MADIQASLALKLGEVKQSVDELKQTTIEQYRERERVRAIKWMRLPLSLQGAATGGALSLGEDQGQELGPHGGFAWTLMRLVVDGLTAGATPDVVNLYRNSSTGQPPLWQFNGNNFGYTFSRLQIVLMPGDTLKLVSVGTFVATGTIRLSGELIEIPGEQLGKFA